MKILGYTYTVDANGDVANIEAFGRMHPKEGRIQIARDICDEQKISTLLHEAIEAVNYHLQLKLEHSQIMSIESALFQVLTENGVDLSPLLGLMSAKTQEAER